MSVSPSARRARPRASSTGSPARYSWRFDLGGMLFGGWCGLVIGAKLVTLSFTRRRKDYEADPAACFSCARCYASCPIEQERLAALGERFAG